MSNVPARSLRAALLGATLLAAPAAAFAAPGTPVQVSTGQTVTPVFTPGSTIQALIPGLADNPKHRAGQAINTAVSPDGKTLLVVTSGYNLLAVPSGPTAGQADPADSEEYVFVYDTSSHDAPKLKQVIKVPNTFIGLVWSPDGSKFYLSGGVSDNVQTYTQTSGSWALSATVQLGHTSYGAAFAGTSFASLGAFLGNGIGLEEAASAAGLAVSPDGALLVVTNIYNDSISLISTATNTVMWEYDLRPYKNTPALAGTAGGETPFDVAIKGSAATGFTAYVTSERDREVVVVPLGATVPAAGSLVRIPVSGSPNRLLLSPDQTRLYVAQDNTDAVAVIDTTTNTVLEEIDTIAPPGVITTAERYTGAAPNSLALSPDGKTLYVTNGGANSLAVIPIAGAGPHTVSGLIPTGWYPNSVSVSKDGRKLYVVNDKSDPGRDPAYENGAANQYVLQLENSGLLTIPVPTATVLASTTQQVATNNGYNFVEDAGAAATMAALHGKIQHVIYIVKENRTFDQILGDLTNGANADPKLTMYGRTITPNFHALATNFVTLDNFLCSGEVSGNGWAWSTESRESDFGTKTIPMNYAGRGSSNDSEGSNRIVDVGLSLSARIAAYPDLVPGVAAYNLYAVLASAFPGGYLNLLPGTNDDFGTDGPESTAGESKQLGHIWDAAIKAGLSVRDYGFFDDIVRYNIPVSIGGIPNIELPQASGTQVAWSTNPALAPYTDIYFRGFDNAFPDAWRWEEWNREFQGYVANGNLPSLSFVRFMHDHTGNFTTAAAGVNTPELQQADNDFAVGKLVETVANSRYASNTLIFVLEDDSQDGPDHVNTHRSTAYIVGPYVKKAVVSTRYSTVNFLRTIEDVLGLDHLSLNDAHQPPMADVFDPTLPPTFSYTAVAAPLLYLTGLRPLLPTAPGGVEAVHPTHTAAWWAEKTKGYDWSSEDKIPAAEYNRILWEGLKGDTPYPGK